MQERNLFGIPIPEGAVRVVIRPVLGPGRSLAIFKGSVQDGSAPDDDEVIFASSRNAEFWDYWDSRNTGKRVANDGATEWKLRLIFFDNKEGEEAFTTDQAFAFFRSGAPRADDSDDRQMRLFKYLKRSTDRSISKLSDSLADMVKAASSAIAAVSTASATALAEVSKQTSVVSEITKALQDEASELKHSIFALQTERVKGVDGKPQTATQELKEAVDTGKMIFGLAESFIGPAVGGPAPPAGPPADTGGK